MRRLVINYLFFYIFCIPFCLLAQPARYSTATTGREVMIAGRVGNTIHVWSSPVGFGEYAAQNITLTLHIFSGDLILLSEKKFSLGTVILEDINFQFTDSCYYANINFGFDTKRHRLVLKVDEEGNMVNASREAGITENNSVTTDLRRLYFMASNNTSLFGLKTDTVTPAAQNNSLIDATSLDGKNTIFGKKNNQIILNKISRADGITALRRVYTSAYLDFFRVFMTANDTSVFVSAFAQKALTGGRKNPYNGSYLFLARLDTNLASITNAPEIVKTTELDKDEIYVPANIFTINKKLLIISKGFYKKTYFNDYGSKNYNPFLMSGMLNTYTISSIRFTMADEKNNLLLDTIIDKKIMRDSYDFGDFFVSTTDKGADFFCTHQFAGSKNGITQFSISSDGKISDKDIIVDESYIYMLTRANKIARGLLAVPCTEKRIYRLMKLRYDPID